MNYPGFSRDDVRTLRFIFDEIDSFHIPKKSTKPKIVIGDNVIVPVTAEFIEHSPDPEKTRTFYERIFKILKKYWIESDMYRQLGGCYEELELIPGKDAAEAIEYANDIIKKKKFGCLETICWESVKKYRKKE